MTRKVLLVLLVLAAVASLAWAAGFDHRAHLKEYAPDTACLVCHVADAPSIVPDQAVCLNCHKQAEMAGIALGPTLTHGPTWSLDHRREAKQGAVDCAACHEQKDCLECHKAGFADEMGALGNSMINVHRGDFHVSHPLAARNDERLCSSCHEPKFCDSCHDAFRLRRGDIGSPSHRYTFDMGLNGDIDAIHSAFDATTSCDSCHLSSSVAPSFHDWQIGHAREARRSLATCQSCHPDGDVCLKCHSARGGAVGFNPHPKDWDDIKGNLNKSSNGKTCRKCH